MSSLKMTFSLASLVLLMAFGFTAMPVMAHESGGSTFTGSRPGDDAKTNAVVKSITAPKWTDGTTDIKVTIVFEAANADKKIIAPDMALELNLI